MAYFHVYTKGLADRDLFLDRDDYIAGMNILAVVCWTLHIDVKLLAFVLMSNHVHFVLHASKEKAERFIWLYKHLLSRYLRNRYGCAKALRGLETAVAELPDDTEALKRLIAYVLNNPVKAGINCVAYGYEWSSSTCYFNQTDISIGASKVGDHTTRHLRSILHSHKKLPATWLVSPAGYILPQSYIEMSYVEGCFKTGRSMEFYLSTSLSLNRGTNENITFSDSILISSMNELLEKKYGVSSIMNMDDFLRKNLVKDLKVRFSASSKQIARITGLPISNVIKFLE